jgi:hypothetical protein
MTLSVFFVDEGVQAVAFDAQRATDAQRLELAGVEQAADGAGADGKRGGGVIEGQGERLRHGHLPGR